jgi:predicted nucleic acid-binding protein
MARQKRPRRHRRVREAAAAGYAAKAPEAVVGVLYDSDVIIEILRGHASVVDSARRLENSGVPTYCSPVSLAEVYAGLRPGEEATTQAFFDTRGEIVLDSHIGRVAGSYLAQYGKSHGVELGDALIASAASATGVSLWTRNRKHYPMADVRFYDAGQQD